MSTNAGSSRMMTSHQLSNGLYVSGAPEQYKERQPTFKSTAMPYTGGDIRKSGELGKMFDIPVIDAPTPTKPGKKSAAGPYRASAHSGPLTGATNPNNNITRSGPQISISGPLISSAVGNNSINKRQGSNSGPLAPANPNHKSSSGPPSRQNSGPLAPNLPKTGLITSGPLSSSGGPRKYSGPLDSGGGVSIKVVAPNNLAINSLSRTHGYSFWENFPKVILWTVIPIFAIGFVAGGFILAAVGNPVLLIVVAGLFGAVILLLLWNSCLGKRAVTEFVSSYPDVGLQNAKDGQYVKVTGVVTCGSVPLESSYQRVSRCVYTSTALYEYRSIGTKPARPKHRTFTWDLHCLERRVVDFYVSDFQSGLRALVKAGYGANVTPYVEEKTIIDIMKKNREVPSNFLRWLSDRNLSSDDRIMRLKEGYVKEGSTVTIMGVVQRHENVLMIVSPPDAVSTGCQFGKFLLPANLEGLVLACEDTSKADVIPV